MTNPTISLRPIRNGSRFNVLIDGAWRGTTVRRDGSFAAGAYLTAEQMAVVACLARSAS